MKDFSLQDQQVIKNFWKARAAGDTNRWTPAKTLDFELEFIGSLRFEGARILDLGSGSGEISRRILDETGYLVAVDFEENFSRFFKGLPNADFVSAHVETFTIKDVFDLILFMGVATHLTYDQTEQALFAISRTLSESGTCVVKHQVSEADGQVLVRGFSEDLGSDYVGRYPLLKDQVIQLKRYFKYVELVRYPEELQFHNNTKHYAFICRK